MKKMFLLLGVALVSLLFTACGKTVSDSYPVKDIVQSLRESPDEWDVKLANNGDITHLTHRGSGKVLLVSNLPEIGAGDHGILELEPAGSTILPRTYLAGEALLQVRNLVDPLTATLVAQEEATKKEASVIKL